MKKYLLLCLSVLLILTACGADQTDHEKEQESTPPPVSEPETKPVETAPPEPEPEPEPVKEPYTILDPTVQPEGGVRDGVTYVPWTGKVEHLFFHPVIAYPELAFDGDRQAKGLDDWMGLAVIGFSSVI